MRGTGPLGMTLATFLPEPLIVTGTTHINVGQLLASLRKVQPPSRYEYLRQSRRAYRSNPLQEPKAVDISVSVAFSASLTWTPPIPNRPPPSLAASAVI